MPKPKPYVCPVCGRHVPNLPMPVLKHQLSHAKPRPYAGVREKRRPDKRPGRQPAGPGASDQ